MGHKDQGPPLRDGCQPLLQALLGIRVHIAGGLVQNQHLRIADQRTGKSHRLPLPTGQGLALLADLGCETGGIVADKIRHPGKGRGPEHQMVIDGGVPQDDILTDAAIKQDHVLGNTPMRPRSSVVGSWRRSTSPNLMLPFCGW